MMNGVYVMSIDVFTLSYRIPLCDRDVSHTLTHDVYCQGTSTCNIGSTPQRVFQILSRYARAWPHLYFSHSLIPLCPLFLCSHLCGVADMPHQGGVREVDFRTKQLLLVSQRCQKTYGDLSPSQRGVLPPAGCVNLSTAQYGYVGD